MDYKKKYLKYKLKYLNAKKTLIGGNPKMMHHQNSSNDDDDDETYSCIKEKCKDKTTCKSCTDTAFSPKTYDSLGCIDHTLDNMEKFYPDILKKKDGKWEVDVTNWSDTQLEQGQKELKTIREDTRNVILNRCEDLINTDVTKHENDCYWPHKCFIDWGLKFLKIENDILNSLKDNKGKDLATGMPISGNYKFLLENFENDLQTRTKMVSIFNKYPENRKLLEHIYKDLKQLKDVPQDTTQLKNILINVYSKLLRKYKEWNKTFIYDPQQKEIKREQNEKEGRDREERANLRLRQARKHLGTLGGEQDSDNAANDATLKVWEELVSECQKQNPDDPIPPCPLPFPDWVGKLITTIWMHLMDTYNISYTEAQKMVKEMNEVRTG